MFSDLLNNTNVREYRAVMDAVSATRAIRRRRRVKRFVAAQLAS